MPYKLPEAERRDLVITCQYDATRFFRNIFHWEGTSFSLIFPNPLYWVFVSIHVLLFFLKEMHDCTEPDAVPNCTPTREIFKKYPLTFSDFSVISSLVTFFVVFYVGNCYSKFEGMYKNVVQIQGHIHNIGLYLRAYYTSVATRWNVMRYPLASQFIFYWSLRHRYHHWESSQYKTHPGEMRDLFFGHQEKPKPRNGHSSPDDEFEGLVPKGILINEEAEALLLCESEPENIHKLLFAWTLVAMKRIMGAAPPDGERGNPMLSSEYEQTALMSNLKVEIVGMREAISEINAGMLFPIPFQYYHMVNFTLNAFLILLAYSFLFIDEGRGSVFSLIAYPMVTFVILGLVETANNMSDPFGQDLALNFNQNAIAEGMYQESRWLCELPEEEFMDQLGDPSFNPQRNADGSLKPAEAKREAGPEPPKEDKVPNHVVQVYIEERDKMSYDVYTHGLKYIAADMAELIAMQTTALQKVAELDRIPAALRAQSVTTLRRIARIEEQLDEYLTAVQKALRGDSYELRYVDARTARTATAGNGTIVSAALPSGMEVPGAGAYAHGQFRHWQASPAPPPPPPK